jgi:peptidoglycan-associated lipoprotein
MRRSIRPPISVPLVLIMALSVAGGAKHAASFEGAAVAPAPTVPAPVPAPPPTPAPIAPSSPGPAPAARSGPAASPPPPSAFSPTSRLEDIHFAFDQYAVGPDDARILDQGAEWLKTNQDLLLIEGHSDERGTSEYNLALGERRATAARSYLVSRGVAARRITTISYGKERPTCADHSEGCWARNRRAHFLVTAG